MKERLNEKPILFKSEMVRAILAGNKTQTRRIAELTDDGRLILQRHRVNGQKAVCCCHLGVAGPMWAPYGGSPDVPMPKDEYAKYAPKGQPGDRMWVRENFLVMPELWAVNHGEQPHYYAADIADMATVEDYVCKPSIHMPRWASRITLEITEVRVQRVQEISEGDAKAEGIERHDDEGVTYFGPMDRGHACPLPEFKRIWDSIYKNWDENPWVWAYTFKVFK